MSVQTRIYRRVLMLVAAISLCGVAPSQFPRGQSGEQEPKIVSFGPLPKDVRADRHRLSSWDIHKHFLFEWRDVTSPKDPQAVIEVTVPAGHKLFTVVINDDKGVRVRNLISMGDVKSYGGDPDSGKPQTLRVAWNGLNDKGNPMNAGNYRVEGLSLPGLKAEFDYAWYNPGNPPWQGYRTSGWGGDHTGPSGVACVPAGSTSKWRVILTWPIVESPHATIALDDKYHKVWGFKRVAGFDGSKSVAIADGHLWLGVKNELLVLQLDTGKNRGWTGAAGRVSAIDLKRPIECVAVGPTYVVALLGTTKEIKTNQIVFLDKKAGADPKTKEFPARIDMEQPTTSIAFAADGTLHAATKTGVVNVDVKGTVTPVELPGLEKPGPLAFDPQGNLFVMDFGRDHQVKVYSPKRELLRTVGTKGGQPISHAGYFWTIPARVENGLAFDASAMHTVQALAVDEFGQLWVPEGHPHPRRVGVWGKDGKLVRQFVGCTDYGAGNTSLHNQDPTRAFSSGVLFDVDPAKTNSYEPKRYLTSGPNYVQPRKGEPPSQRLNTQAQATPFTVGQLFRSDASGKMREYYLSTLSGFPVLFREKDGDYRPVVAIGTVAATRGILSKPEFAKKPGTVYIWCDANEDGLVQEDEIQALPAGGNGRIMDFYGWNYLIQPDLVFYTNGFALAPTRFTASGAPFYDMTKARKLKENDLFLRVGKHLVGTAGTVPFQIGVYKFADLEGKTTATYPLTAFGVHSAEHSLIPGPGQTAGDLFFMGTADMGERVGSVVASIGDMGQAFLFTEDGMYISSLFRDTRANPRPYPARAEKGADFTDCTMSGEPFGVWFGRQDDGKVRVLFGRNEAIVCQVKGLDQIQRLAPTSIRVATNVPVTRSAPTQPAKTTRLVIPRLLEKAGKIEIDGGLGEWRNVPSYKITAGDAEVGTVQMVHDGTNLYLAYRVLDSSPLQNKAQDERAYFKEGDCVDLAVGPFRATPGSDPIMGDLRLLLVPTSPRPTAVLYRSIVPGTKEKDRVKLSSPIGTTLFDSVKKAPEVQLAFSAVSGGYVCEVRVPFKSLGVKYEPGVKLLGDLGILFSDPEGQNTTSRAYLFNKTKLTTADLCEEAKLHPYLWGTLELE